MDHEVSAAIWETIREIMATLKRIEEKQTQTIGELSRMRGQQTRPEERMDEKMRFMEAALARVQTDLQEFRKESREQSDKTGRRLDHHDLKLMEHDRRIMELENDRTGD